MLPFSVTTEDGPIYVNPKQYHGILRRRKMRAKEGMKSRSAKDKVNCLTLSFLHCKYDSFNCSSLSSIVAC